MYLPKSDIYSYLNDLKTIDYTVTQATQNVFNELPVVTFQVSTNKIRLYLNNDIMTQDIEITIDIWADDSVTASNILSDVEKTMRYIGYKMTYSADVPNIDKIFHIVSRFQTIGGK
jgi:hypothetical protein